MHGLPGTRFEFLLAYMKQLVGAGRPGLRAGRPERSASPTGLLRRCGCAMDLGWQGYNFNFGLRVFPTQALAITQPTSGVRTVVLHCSMASVLVVHRKIVPPRKFCVHVRMNDANFLGGIF